MWPHRCGCHGRCKRTGEERWLSAYIPDHPTIREEDVGCINAPHSVGAVHVLALWCVCVCWFSLRSLSVTCPGHALPQSWPPPSVSGGQKVGKAAVSHNCQIWVGSALELLQMLVASDAGCDDDRRCNSELLAREINRLDSLDTFELIDGERVAFHTAATVAEVCETPPIFLSNSGGFNRFDPGHATVKVWQRT